MSTDSRSYPRICRGPLAALAPPVPVPRRRLLPPRAPDIVPRLAPRRVPRFLPRRVPRFLPRLVPQSNGPRTEPVTHRFTMGGSVVRSYLDRQLVEPKYVRSGFRIAIGILIGCGGLYRGVGSLPAAPPRAHTHVAPPRQGPER